MVAVFVLAAAYAAIGAFLVLRVLWHLGSVLRDARAYLRAAPALPRAEPVARL